MLLRNLCFSFGDVCWISAWRVVPFIFLGFPCFLSFPLVFLDVCHFFVFFSLVFHVFYWLSCIFLTCSLFFIGLPCFSIRLSCMFPSGFPCSPTSHLSVFIYISRSRCSLVFLEPNLAVAVAAAIAVALVLVAVAIAVV